VFNNTVGYDAEATTICRVTLPAPGVNDATGTVTSPAVMLSPNARNRVLDNVGSLEMLTANEHVPVRLSESVAVQVTSVEPIGKLEPEPGEHVTLTVPWPPVTGGASKSSVIPAALVVEREMASTHAKVGGFATGGGGGGGGVGAVGVLLQPATSPRLMTTAAKPDRTAQYFTKPINNN
jgi:hypothetical protein